MPGTIDSGWPDTQPPEAVAFHRCLLHIDTLQALRETAQMLAPVAVAVEIGSWLGQSAQWLISECRVGHLYCVDTWLGSPEMMSEVAIAKDPHRQFLANMWQLRALVTPVRMDSVGGIVRLKHAGIEPQLVFIDGGHEYEQVYADCHAAMRLYPQATVLLDDYPLVRLAAQDVCLKFGRAWLDRGWAAVIPPNEGPS